MLVLIPWIFVLGPMVPPRCLAAEIQPAKDAPQPLPPEQSQKQFQLPAGFRIELVASEPLLADPTAMAFDAQGRIFVCELHGYNLDGHYDVQELNKTGVLDKTVRRIPANPAALERAEKGTYGTVKLLADTDGDGRMDRQTIWADHLPACYGVVAARDGVIVLCAPDIVYVGDADHDGKADVRETLFTGFGVGELWTRISNPRWGVDNWIYAACGVGSAGTIRGPHLPSPVTLGNTSFRFKADGSRLEPVSGGTSGFGLALTDWDDRFLVANQEHALYVAPLPYHYLARNPHHPAPNTVINISSYGHPARVFPAAPPDPWRLKRSQEAEWVKFYGASETAMGLITAACAPIIYRAGQFPAEYRDNHFTCDPAYNLIHRCLLVPQGASFQANRATENVEFLTSTEQWFRPVNLALGPEGALYIVDMYREIIEDYSAIPRYLQQQYGLISGHDRGRIWRIVYGENKVPPASTAGRVPPRGGSDLQNTNSSTHSPGEGTGPTDYLLAELSSDNAWRRETAQRLLVERVDPAATGPLKALLRDGRTPQSRLHALYTLAGLATLSPALLQQAMHDPHPGVRLHALRLADVYLDQAPALVDEVLRLVDDPDPKVRLQVAFSLGETWDARRLAALAALASKYGDDCWMQTAIMSSTADSARQLLQALLLRQADRQTNRHLIRPLSAVIGTRQQASEISDLLHAIAQYEANDAPLIQTNVLAGLLEGMQRGKAVALTSPNGQAALRQLLANHAVPVQRQALQLAGLLKLPETPEMRAAFAALAQAALDGDRSLPQRQSDLALLASAPASVLASLSEKLLDPRQPLDLQEAAMAALATIDDPAIHQKLLASWKQYSPKLQTVMLDALFRQQSRITLLLDAIENGSLPTRGLDTLRRGQLLNFPDEAIRRRAQKLFGSLAPEPQRQELLARYQAALANPRDAQRGQTLYQEHCAKCHSILGEGGKIGPELSGTKGRAEEILLQDILQPSDQITVGFRSYSVFMANGDIFTGILSAETATSVTMPGEDGRDQSLLRKDIDSIQMSEISLMPENFSDLLRPQDVADILGYLRTALAQAPSSVAVLFEDDRTFPELLNEGTGTATVVTEGPHAGSAALQVTPPQRFSDKIPGWNYRIVENPGPGEFCFLRFAWKSPSAQGVMLELAADAQWPPGDKPLRRYYCGVNTTGWQARQLSDSVPREWAVLTVDLWRDFGPFTLTGMAPTAMGGPAMFDSIELLRAPPR